MKYFMYRRGDGNEGNFPRQCVALNDDDCPFAALKALVVNEYQIGRYTRRFIAKNLNVDGDSNRPMADIYQGPGGAMAFDACWLTAELEPIEDVDVPGRAAYYNSEYRPIREVLDKGALRYLEKRE